MKLTIIILFNVLLAIGCTSTQQPKDIESIGCFTNECSKLRKDLDGPNPIEMVYVGYLSRDCSKIINDKSIPSIPLNFKVTPIVAAQALPKGCNSKFFYGVYADGNNYYLVNNNIILLKPHDASIIRKYSFVINSQTGELMSEPNYD